MTKTVSPPMLAHRPQTAVVPLRPETSAVSRKHARRTRLSLRRVAAVLGVAVACVIVVGALELPDLEQWIAEASRSLGEWTYLVVGVLAFFETAAFVGLVVPGETAVLAGGMVAQRGEIELVPLILVVWLAAAAGDTTSFVIGRRLGRAFLAAHGARLWLDAPRLARVDAFYARHGATAVIAGRFVGVARATMPFLAGTSRLAPRRFVAFSLTGALAWSTLLALAGYAFSGSIGAANDALTRIAVGAVLVVAALLVVYRRIRSGGAGRVGHDVQPQRAELHDDAERPAHHGAENGRAGSGRAGTAATVRCSARAPAGPQSRRAPDR